MARVLELIENVLAQLSSANWAAAAVALLIHVANVVVRTRAWRNIVALAYPGVYVSWRRLFVGYAAGAGINALSPWRGGDFLRLAIARRVVPGSTYAGLTCTVFVESLFNTAAAACLLAAAVVTGSVPGLRMAGASAFLVAAVGAAGLLFALTDRGRRLASEFAAGVRVLRKPRTYLTSVVSWQALDWVLRLATIYVLMHAFGLDGGVGVVILVQTVQSASGFLPGAPARIGAKQALLVYALGAQTNSVPVLAFATGSELVFVASNAMLGIAALTALARSPRLRSAPVAA